MELIRDRILNKCVQAHEKLTDATYDHLELAVKRLSLLPFLDDILINDGISVKDGKNKEELSFIYNLDIKSKYGMGEILSINTSSGVKANFIIVTSDFNEKDLLNLEKEVDSFLVVKL